MIFPQIGGVDDGYALASREPQMPIGRLPGARVPAGRRLFGWQSVGGAIGNDMRVTRECFSTGYEFGCQDAHDPLA